MRFPSLTLLAERAVAVARRFPWTLLEDGTFNVFADQSSSIPVTGFDWMVPVHSGETTMKTAGRRAGRSTVRYSHRRRSGSARIRCASSSCP